MRNITLFTKKNVLLLVAFVGVALVMGLLVWQFTSLSKKLENTNTPINTEVPVQEPKYIRALDGSFVMQEDLHQYVGLMIDNSPESRPHAGLSLAPLVFEVPVEGGMTRFLAVFDVADINEKIGPVRSARPYFLDLADSVVPMYGHVGGSAQAIKEIKKHPFFDLDQFYQSQYYWRSSDRSAPHNVYISSELLGKAFRDKADKLAPRTIQMWTYKSQNFPVDHEGKDMKTVAITYGKLLTNVSWQYEPVDNKYIRYAGQEIHKDDQTNKLVTAKNVLIAEMAIKILDNEGRRQITTTGTGKAKIIMDGQAFDGTWKRAKTTDLIRFFDSKGEEVRLNRGTTWVEVVESLSKVEVK